MSFPDCDVHTIFLRGVRREELEESIPGEVSFLALKSGALRGLKFDVAHEIQAMIAGSEPDLIIAHRYKPFFIASILNYRLKLSHVIGVMHEFGFLGRATRSFFARFWKKNVSLIGVSDAVCEEIVQSHAALKPKIFKVPHAMEAQTLNDSVTARHTLGIPLGVFCYGTVGRLVWKKNHELLLEAFAKLPDDRPCLLAIVGDGDLLDDLKAKSISLKIADRVVFCGEHENAQIYLKAFDAFVLSSSAEEAFGIVLLEAMAARVPIVCSDAPGPLSVIKDAGLSFKSGDVDDLCGKMTTLRDMTREEIAAQLDRGIERLADGYSMSAFTSRLRGLPPIRDLGLPQQISLEDPEI